MATIDDRVDAIELDGLPSDARWRYVVMCQCTAASADRIDAWGAATSSRRPDISVVRLPGRGAARSRNAAIAGCTTEALLFTDDDVRLLPAGIEGIITTFQQDETLGVFSGRTLLLDSGLPAKRYPSGPRRLTLFNSAKIGTVELAVRPRRVRAKGIQFDAAFGAGSANPFGDEYIFVADCLKAGLKGVYRPIVIAVHRGATSGFDFGAAAGARAKVFERVFSPWLVPFVKLAFLLKHRRRFATFGAVWRFARAFMPFQRP